MNNAATRTYLREQMGCADAAQANAIIAQGLTLATLPDFGKAGIKTACISARRPGGVDAEGNPNRGELIPAIVEEKLKIATSVAKYYVSVARPATADALNWNRIKAFRSYEEQAANWKDALPPVEYSKEVGIVAWLENMQEVLTSTLGVSGSPLGYVTREAADVPVVDELRANTPYGVSYISFQDELMARTSHESPAYTADNAKVLLMLKNGLKATQYIQSIHPFARDRDGRGAWLALHVQHLGPAIWDGAITAANKILNTAVWNGKSSRYPLQKHFSNLRAAYTELVRASKIEGVEVTLPNDRLRVTLALQSIQCTNVAVISGKTNVINLVEQRNNFESFATFMTLATSAELGFRDNVRQISAVDMEGYSDDDAQTAEKPVASKKKGKGGSGKKRHHAGKGETGVEFRYYESAEFHALSDEQKTELIEHRISQGNDTNKKGRGRGAAKRQISALETQNMQLMQQLYAANAKATAVPPAGSSTNRTNGALQRRTALQTDE